MRSLQHFLYSYRIKKNGEFENSIIAYRKEFAKEFKSAKEFKEFMKDMQQEVSDEFKSNLDIIFKAINVPTYLGDGERHEELPNSMER